MRKFKPTTISLILLSLFFLSCAHHPGKPCKTLTPREIVELFMEVYGTAGMTDVSPYLTNNFRDEEPEPLWVINSWNGLKAIKYKRISGKIIKERIEKDIAYFEVESTISAAGGKVDQRELYVLIMDKRKGWLLDELKVGDEILEETMEQT